MINYTDQDLLELIQEGESSRVEFKESLVEKQTREAVREAICAFANDLPDHRQPGLIFVGVKDDGSIAGATIADALIQQLKAMKTDGHIVPPPILEVEKRKLPGGEVAVVMVAPSESPPVRCRGRIQVRVGSCGGIATAQDERMLNEKRRHRDRPFDIQPISDTGLSDLNLTAFTHEYLPQAFSKDVLDANDRSIEEQLAATKMIEEADQPVATVLGILTLGKNPQDFLPGAYVQFLRINGTGWADEIIDAKRFGGAISDVVSQLDDNLSAHNRQAVSIPATGTDRRIHLYPMAALQQVVRNAVMHRNYESGNAPVRITWLNDRVEVISPGGPYGDVNEQNFGVPGITGYRNPNLAEAMRTLGYVQRFGVGIPITKKLLAEAEHPPPNFDVSSGFVQVTLRSKTET